MPDSNQEKSESIVGAIEWRDLTVQNATEVSGFYQAVVGWQAEPVPMNGYDDYNMSLPSGGDAVAGVCHALGENANIPPQWMMYVRVANVNESVVAVERLGGSVLAGPNSFGGDVYYVIRDPAGAVLTIFSEAL